MRRRGRPGFFLDGDELGPTANIVLPMVVVLPVALMSPRRCGGSGANVVEGAEVRVLVGVVNAGVGT